MNATPAKLSSHETGVAFNTLALRVFRVSTMATSPPAANSHALANGL